MTSIFLSLLIGGSLLAVVTSQFVDVNSVGGLDDMVVMSSRDSEPLPGPLSLGHKYMTGGAGEGDQKLEENGEYKHRESVKSDNVLPAYCDPPNPCPVGFSAEQGCLEDFDNTADFSREYQAQQQCVCDQEHMFNCAEKQANSAVDSLQKILDDSTENGREEGVEEDEGDDEVDEMLRHHGLMAKKFHEKRTPDDYVPRKKRSVSGKQPNPYLQGEPLRSVSKKDGRHSW